MWWQSLSWLRHRSIWSHLEIWSCSCFSRSWFYEILLVTMKIFHESQTGPWLLSQQPSVGQCPSSVDSNAFAAYYRSNWKALDCFSSPKGYLHTSLTVGWADKMQCLLDNFYQNLTVNCCLSLDAACSQWSLNRLLVVVGRSSFWNEILYIEIWIYFLNFYFLTQL